MRRFHVHVAVSATKTATRASDAVRAAGQLRRRTRTVTGQATGGMMRSHGRPPKLESVASEDGNSGSSDRSAEPQERSRTTSRTRARRRQTRRLQSELARRSKGNRRRWAGRFRFFVPTAAQSQGSRIPRNFNFRRSTVSRDGQRLFTVPFRLRSVLRSTPWLLICPGRIEFGRRGKRCGHLRALQIFWSCIACFCSRTGAGGTAHWNRCRTGDNIVANALTALTRLVNGHPATLREGITGAIDGVLCTARCPVGCS